MSEEETPYEEVTTGQEVPEKEGLLEELERLRKAGETSTARYQEVLKQVEVAFGTGQTNFFVGTVKVSGTVTKPPLAKDILAVELFPECYSLSTNNELMV